MLYVSNVSTNIKTIINEFPDGSIEKELLSKMSASNEKYSYDNLSQLKFELNLRKKIVNAAISLNDSDLAFADFKDSKCNSEYWIRTFNGGFLLKEDANPSDAMDDIFINGDKYATECATAIMIIYYKALLDVFKSELFNETFPVIYLMDWDVKEPLLKEASLPKLAEDILLGDRAYFNNPDFNPFTPEWRGENVIVLPDSLYYGHGIGIATADVIIEGLNSKRKEDATLSAYLLDSVGRPNFKKLYGVYQNVTTSPAPLAWGPFPAPISRRWG